MLVRSLIVAMLFALGLSLGPAAPALAADCTARGAGVDLQYCNLSGLDLSWATLTGANLQGANLRDTNLNGARLAGANLAYADLRGATFSGANLRGAILTGARVYPDTLSGANTRGAKLGVIMVDRPVVAPAITVTFTFDTVQGGITFCFPTVQLSGFQPDTTYTVQLIYGGLTEPGLDGSVTTDGTGAAVLAQPFSVGASDFTEGDFLEARVDGVSSGEVVVACQTP